MADVEDEIARAIRTVADKGGAGGQVGMGGEGRDVHTIGGQPGQGQAAEIIGPDTGYQRHRLTQTRGLRREDRRRTRGEGSGQGDGFGKTVPGWSAMISTRVSPMTVIRFMAGVSLRAATARQIAGDVFETGKVQDQGIVGQQGQIACPVVGAVTARLADARRADARRGPQAGPGGLGRGSRFDHRHGVGFGHGTSLWAVASGVASGVETRFAFVCNPPRSKTA